MYHLARVPGGVMAYFFWALQAVNPSTSFIHEAAVTMNAIGLLLIPVLFRRFLGWTGAFAVAAFYAGALVVLEELWKFWNPSLTPLFTVLIWWCLLAYVEDGGR